MRLSILVAMTPDRVIGLEGALPWHLPADLAHFKRLTMGHHIIMGRRTFDSLDRTLPGRTIVIVTRGGPCDTCTSYRVSGLEQAIAVCEGDAEPFVVGGGEIYRVALPLVDRIYQTLVDADLPGDVYFPELDEKQWVVVDQQRRDADDRNPYVMTFRTLDRIK